jgi:hypothetical protein
VSDRFAATGMAIFALAAPALAWAQASNSQGTPSCAADMARIGGDWGGLWIAENMEVDMNGREMPGGVPLLHGMKFSALSAPWSDEGWSRIGDTVRMGLSEATNIGGWSYPLMMSSPAPFKFIISPGETAIISQYRDIRYVYTDGRGHEPDDERWATPWGDSTGCWDGGTLTIETVGVRYVPAYTFLSPPLSENAHFVERMRVVAPGRIESEVTVMDAETLTQPWQVHMVYLRHPANDRLVHDGETYENDRLVFEGGSATISDPADAVPAARSPARPSVELSAAQLDRVVGSYTFDGTPAKLTIERRGDRLFSRIDPFRPLFLPMQADDDLSFFSPTDGVSIRFIADGAGRIRRFEGKSPDNTPIAGARDE